MPGGTEVQDAARSGSARSDSTRTTVGTPYDAGGRDDVADLFLAAGAVLEVEQHPVDAGAGADLGGDRRTRCRGRCRRWPRRDRAGPGAPRFRAYGRRLIRTTAGLQRPCSYSARAVARRPRTRTPRRVRRPTSTPADGRSACGMTGTTMTTVPGCAAGRRPARRAARRRWWPAAPWRRGRRRSAPGRPRGSRRRAAAAVRLGGVDEVERLGAVAELVAELAAVAEHLQPVDHLVAVVLRDHHGDRRCPPGRR